MWCFRPSPCCLPWGQGAGEEDDCERFSFEYPDTDQGLPEVEIFHNRLILILEKYQQVDHEGTNFYIWHRKAGSDDWRSSSDDGTFTCAILDELEADTLYEIRITAHKCCQRPKVVDKFMASTRFAGPPEGIHVIELGDGNARLEWEQPAICGPDSPITGYVVQITTTFSSGATEHSEHEFEADVTSYECKVDNQNSYMFKLRAMSNDKYSQASQTGLLLLKHRILRGSSKLQSTQNPPTYLAPLKCVSAGMGTDHNVFEFGTQRKGQESNEKVLMLLGLTGSGKTMLINTLFNYILGVEFADNFRFKICESSLGSRAGTERVTVYRLHHQHGFKISYTLTVIDTPGFDSPYGVLRDKMIVDEIRTLFKRKVAVKRLDAIGFVAKSTDEKLTSAQAFIFESIRTLFGTSMDEKTHLLMTFSDGINKPDILTAINSVKFPYQTSYIFNSQAVYGGDSENNVEAEDSTETAWHWVMSNWKNVLDKCM